ncbi:MAG: 30S ribosomal protein S3 [Promethearchaeota archaeon]
MSPLAKHFIEAGIKLMQINEYLRSELLRAGFAGVEIQKTPLGVRITLKTSRPGLVIGKGGKRIQEITDVLEQRFGLEMPQIEVEEVENPDLDAQIMAERLAYSLDRGRHYRRAGYYILRKVMDAGARGVEIRISGKVTSQRARTQIFRAGTMKKSGQTAQEAVQKGVAQCILKTGVMGVVVKIMKPDYRMGDGIKVHYDELEQLQKQKEAQKAKTKAEEIIEKGMKEGELEVEEEEIFEEVEDEDVKEISLEPEINKEEDL